MKMMNKRLREYRMYQSFVRAMLTFSGCWYMPKSNKSTYHYAVCVFLTMIMFTTLGLHMSYIFRHNLMNLMKSISLAISGLSAILKLGTFMLNRDALINYHRMLNDLFQEELMQNKEVQTVIFSTLRRTYSLAYGQFAIHSSLILGYFTSPYFFIIRGLLHSHLTTNYTLPVSGGYGYFWTVPTDFLYHLHLLFETSMATLSTMTACSVDNAFGFYVYQFSSTMRAMSFRLMNPLPTEKFLDLLRMCVSKHQRLLQCRDTLNHIYGPIVFWHIITNAILLCALIYNVTPFSDFKNLYIFGSYALVKLLQTFTYSWYGTVLTNAAEDFRNGIYFSEWLNSSLSRQVKANVILVMMQKPMTVSAFYSPVSITMFTNFMNTTISYFFLLQSVGDKDG